MKIGAIICEYNPLHNGHIYQIQETRKAGITHLIGILSDDFVQRGDTAVLNKFQRAELAVQAGMDLIIELPFPYSCSSAECYARGAVQLLKDLNIAEILSFGCMGELENLKILSEILISMEHSDRLQSYLKSGKSYPSAVFQAVAETYPEYQNLLSDSNNLLALEYLKAIKKSGVSIQPFGILRTGVPHDSMEISGSFASASLIRKKLFLHEAFQEFVPDFTAEILKQHIPAEFSNLEQIILYQIRMLSEFEQIPDMTPELAGKFLKAKNSVSLEMLFTSLKSKNITLARIRRMLIYILTGIQKEDLHLKIPYARILALNQRGAELLKLIRKNSSIPAETSLAKLKSLSPETAHFVQMQEHSAHLYGLAFRKFSSAETEFRQKITLYQK